MISISLRASTFNCSNIDADQALCFGGSSEWTIFCASDVSCVFILYVMLVILNFCEWNYCWQLLNVDFLKYGVDVVLLLRKFVDVSF